MSSLYKIKEDYKVKLKGILCTYTLKLELEMSEWEKRLKHFALIFFHDALEEVKSIDNAPKSIELEWKLHLGQNNQVNLIYGKDFQLEKEHKDFFEFALNELGSIDKLNELFKGYVKYYNEVSRSQIINLFPKEPIDWLKQNNLNR